MESAAATKLSQMSRLDREKFLRKYLGNEFELRGDNLPVLESVINFIERADHTMELIELLPKLGHWLGRFGIVSFAAEGFAVASIALFPVGAMLSVINAAQTGQRLYGLRAVAYATTAFAFGDAIPTSSPTMVYNSTVGILPANLEERTAQAKAWKDASDSALENIRKSIESPKGEHDKRTLQLVFKALGENNRQKLCLRILKGFAEDMQPIPKRVFESEYKILYPN